MSRMTACLLLLCVAGGQAHAAEPISPVNRAGEQRMLSQRTVKFYCQVGMEVMPSHSRIQLQDSIARFDANLVALKPVAATSQETAQAFERLVRAWGPLRAATAIPASRESALILARHAEDVLAAAERLTRSMEDASGQPESRAINLAGRQRMLSQRLAKAYMLRSWGVDSAAVREEMDAAANEFNAALALLVARPENTGQINSELQDLALQWEWLQTAVASEGAATYRLIVAEASEAILVAADRITRLYDEVARR
jgi:Type IV pili methyl-accepting chemotaxis transducer N-term